MSEYHIEDYMTDNQVVFITGPRGVGKSTLCKIIMEEMKPDSGEILVFEHSVRTEPQKVKTHIGVVPQEIALYEDLSARENLYFWGKMYGLRGSTLKTRVDEVLELIGLVDRQKDRVSKYSGGMKRRLGIAQALIGNPKIIVVDEPTTGLDPEERIRFRNLLADLTQKDIIIILSTHIVSDISSTCTDMALLNNGEVAGQVVPHLHVHIIPRYNGETRGVEELFKIDEELKDKTNQFRRKILEETLDYHKELIEIDRQIAAAEDAVGRRAVADVAVGNAADGGVRRGAAALGLHLF